MCIRVLSIFARMYVSNMFVDRCMSSVTADGKESTGVKLKMNVLFGQHKPKTNKEKIKKMRASKKQERASKAGAASEEASA